MVHWKTKHRGLEKQECEKYLANKSFKIQRKVTEHLIVQSEHLLNLAAQFCIVSQSGVSWPCNCGIWFSGAVFTLTVSHHRHHWRVLRGVGSTGSTGIRRHFYDSSGKVSSFGHKIVQGSSVKTPWVPPPPTCPNPRLVFSPCTLLPRTGWGEHRGGLVSRSLSLVPVISVFLKKCWWPYTHSTLTQTSFDFKSSRLGILTIITLSEWNFETLFVSHSLMSFVYVVKCQG